MFVGFLKRETDGKAEGKIDEILGQIKPQKGLQAKDVNCNPLAAAKEIPKEPKVLNYYLSTHRVWSMSDIF